MVSGYMGYSETSFLLRDAMQKISLKEFITELSSRLDKLSSDELRAIILQHAETLSPTERQPFLDIFSGFFLLHGKLKQMMRS